MPQLFGRNSFTTPKPAHGHPHVAPDISMDMSALEKAVMAPSAWGRLDETKSLVVVAVGCFVPVAIRGTQPPGFVVPGTATHNPVPIRPAPFKPYS